MLSPARTTDVERYTGTTKLNPGSRFMQNPHVLLLVISSIIITALLLAFIEEPSKAIKSNETNEEQSNSSIVFSDCPGVYKPV